MKNLSLLLFLLFVGGLSYVMANYPTSVSAQALPTIEERVAALESKVDALEHKFHPPVLH